MAALSQEEDNYVRMSLLLMGVSPRAVRVLFDREFAPVCLSSTLKKERTKLFELHGKRVINNTQLNLLFPRKGVTKSEAFDVTLMICLLTNLANVTGYERPPSPQDKTPGSDLARIKFYRNKLAHLKESRIATTKFNDEWEDILGAIGRLGGNQMKLECQDLKTKILDQSTVPWNIRDQINKRLEEWQKTNQKFVVTHATENVLQCIQTNNCVTVTASSGVGKTATIRHVALLMKEEEYDILPIDDPCNIINYYHPDRKILFVSDDFCGRYVISQTELDKWKKQMDLIEPLLKTNHTKLIIGCRLQVYQDQKFKALSLFTSTTNNCNLLSNKLVCLTQRKNQ